MQSRAGMWHHVGRTMKIVRNTLFVVGGELQRGRKRKIVYYFIPNRSLDFKPFRFYIRCIATVLAKT